LLAALNDRETFSAAKLTRVEQERILADIEATSFDTPDSWLDELRVRRISLGEAYGLVIRATRLLCGATGNCETWVFRHAAGQWVNALDGEAPVASSIGFVRQTDGTKDLVITANLSAEAERWTQYRFDGGVYRRTVCYNAHGGPTSERVETVPCATR
jgi:hypothetical protein